jgi:hypothetical protein
MEPLQKIDHTETLSKQKTINSINNIIDHLNWLHNEYVKLTASHLASLKHLREMTQYLSQFQVDPEELKNNIKTTESGLIIPIN